MATGGKSNRDPSGRDSQQGNATVRVGLELDDCGLPLFGAHRTVNADVRFPVKGALLYSVKDREVMGENAHLPRHGVVQLVFQILDEGRDFGNSSVAVKTHQDAFSFRRCFLRRAKKVPHELGGLAWVSSGCSLM